MRQRTAAPTRKIQYAAIAAAIIPLALAILHAYVHFDLDPTVATALAAATPVVVGYITTPSAADAPV